MVKSSGEQKKRTPFHIIDALLCLLAGSAMTIISISFLLWLRF